MTVRCILSHRAFVNGGFVDYVSGQTYTMDALYPLFFEEVGGAPSGTFRIETAVSMVTNNVHYANIDVSGGSKTYTLPAASGCLGRMYVVKKTDSSSNAVTLDADGAELIDAAETLDITGQNDAYSIVSDGIGWKIS